MSLNLDNILKTTGTKFRVFPQPTFLNAFKEPEEIYVNVKPHEIKPGPSDARMFVVDALDKQPYNDKFAPFFNGNFNTPVEAGPDGHFTHLDVDSRQFICASTYATVRRVLDIWEDYFKRCLPWHFETDFDRLEIIPAVNWTNAHSGYGFLEFGFAKKEDGKLDVERPYCQNFDVIAHEVGHSIIYSVVGVPSAPNDRKFEYRAMHESAADLVAIISLLHFNKVVDHLLESTKGNLFTVNELMRIGELTESSQMRTAFNSLRMSDVTFEPHNRSLPLTGAIYDIFVEVFQKKLVEKNFIEQQLADMSTQGLMPIRGQDLNAIQDGFNQAYLAHRQGFKTALLEARDYLGRLLAITWGKINPNFLTFHDIIRELLHADREVEESKGLHQQTIRECFMWRQIKLQPGSLLMQRHMVHDDED